MSTTPRPYCSQPSLRGDHLVFVTGGQLWSLRLGERRARRLTDVSGQASRPLLSPDGKQLAFAATDDGPSAVFVMPAEGGEARRLVHHSSPSLPVAFSPDGDRVYFVSALASWSRRIGQLFSVSMEGGDVRAEGLGPGEAIAWSADGKHVAISRGYQDPATWKRYAGGLAGQVWAGDAQTLELRRLTTGPRGECQPSFWGDRIVYLSDADGTGNLWSRSLDDDEPRQHTHHEEYYARWPSLDGSRVVYQHGGDLILLDLESGESEWVDVEVAADNAATRRRYVDAFRFLEAIELDDDGSHVTVTARGKVFSMPAWRGPVRAVGDHDGVRFGHAAQLSNGGLVLAHDENGEEELELRSVDGADEPRSLGPAGEGRLRGLYPSPDGRFVAISEQASGLSLLTIDSGERKAVDAADSGAILEVSWSPDSRYLAYARPKHYRSSIFIHDVDTGQTHRITSEEFDDGAPCFDPGGRYLYFLGRRVYNPYRDELEHDVGFPATTQPFAVVLAADRLSPLAPLPADELGLAPGSRDPNAPRDEETPPAETDVDGEEGEEAAETEESEETEETPRADAVRVDFEGIERRVVEIPVQEGRYFSILASRDKVFFLRRPLQGMAGRKPDRGDDTRENRLVAFDLASREEQVYAHGVRAAALSRDASQLLVVGQRHARLLSTKAPPKNTAVSAGKPGEKSGVLDLSRIRLRVEPRTEWRQMFAEAWRQQRGHFWTESMSAVDWDAMRARYEPLVERVRCREELSDVLWELQGELGTSHAYVVGGDVRPRETYRVGLLGADFERDDTGRHRITAIHVGDTWAPGAHSPLALPGHQVEVGDYLLAVDGREAGDDVHPWSLLERPGSAVSLTIAKDSEGESQREVVVTPLLSEHACRYREWVERARRTVDELTDGRVGYVHVPDMQVAGLVEFHRGFLFQSHRDGLIVDVRDNGGGNVSQILLGKLRRQLVGYCKARWAEPEPLPSHTMNGPMVALCNERTGSDGDIFCQSWRQLGLGPLIGQRTWGGVIGIDRGKRLLDRGYITQPEYAFWFEDRGWDVEGSGVEPDIPVPITPADHSEGRDPQLLRAVDEIMKLLETKGGKPVELPPPPDRSRR
ncbi:MAG: S41 family peptidase [Acidobacteriota bacterium]